MSANITKSMNHRFSSLEFFYDSLFVMALVGLVVFIVLYHVDAGYGKMRSDKWGPAINNKLGWILMEMPVFLVVLYLWTKSDIGLKVPYLVFFLLFELHYFQRTFIFPLLMRGQSKMPIIIMALSVLWNLFNGYIQGMWLFYFAPIDPQYQTIYTEAWLTDPRFIIGVILFFTGMAINWHSDYVIRHLRKPGDTNHYLPKKGLYRFVTSANYFGEITEWAGFALLTWSWAGLLFFWFSCCNLVPRANSIYLKYEKEFPDEFDRKKLKRIIPFIY